jgi:hypothetical protein
MSARMSFVKRQTRYQFFNVRYDAASRPLPVGHSRPLYICQIGSQDKSGRMLPTFCQDICNGFLITRK